MQVVDGVMTDERCNKEGPEMRASVKELPLIAYFEHSPGHWWIVHRLISSHLKAIHEKQKLCKRPEEKFAAGSSARSETKYFSYKYRKPLTGNVWNLREISLSLLLLSTLRHPSLSGFGCHPSGPHHRGAGSKVSPSP